MNRIKSTASWLITPNPPFAAIVLGAGALIAAMNNRPGTFVLFAAWFIVAIRLCRK